MSSPTRLLSNRRPTPLPNQYAPYATVDLVTKPKMAQDYEEWLDNERPNTKSTYIYWPHLQRMPRRPAKVKGSQPELPKNTVQEYLRYHKSFLEEYVMKDIPKETLEKWLYSKAQQDGTMGRGGLARKISLQASRQGLVKMLTETIKKGTEWRKVVYQLAEAIASATDADTFVLMLCDKVQLRPKKMLQYADWIDEWDQQECVVRKGDTLPGYVGATKTMLNTNVLEERHDPRFPKGPILDSKSLAAGPMLCVPIVEAYGEKLVGVLELIRLASEPRFGIREEEVLRKFLTCGAVAIQYSLGYTSWRKDRRGREREREEEVVDMEAGGEGKEASEQALLSREKDLNEVFLHLTRKMLEKMDDMQSIIKFIEKAVTKLVAADRGSLFLVNDSTKELYAYVFSVPLEESGAVESKPVDVDPFPTLTDGEETSSQDLKELLMSSSVLELENIVYKGEVIRFPTSKGVAGLVARTGALQNVPNARNDMHFNCEVDSLTSYSTQSILAAPIKSKGKVIGVLEAINKKEGSFSDVDEAVFQTFATFCGLAVCNFKLHKELKRCHDQYKVTADALAYHRQCTQEELQHIKDSDPPGRYTYPLESYEMDTRTVPPDHMIHLCIRMFAGVADISVFSLDRLFCFVLTVAKSYRRVPYHNWVHAFSVTQVAYSIFMSAPKMFSEFEKLSLLVACLCHDLDHMGFNNDFMVRSKTPVAALYSSSVLERHHFMQALVLLKMPGLDIFSHLPAKDYKAMLAILKVAIISTDLQLLTGNRNALQELVNTKTFRWDNPKHRELVYCLMVPVCDIAAICKPWDVHKGFVEDLYKEFNEQGDTEKEKGMVPQKMLDRNFLNDLPKFQIGFMKFFAIPCCELLSTLLPETLPLLKGALTNMQRWQAMADDPTSTQ